MDNPEHTHPLSGKKAGIQKEINSLKNPSFRHALSLKREQIVKMADGKQGKKGRMRPFSGAYAPRGAPGVQKRVVFRSIPTHLLIIFLIIT